MLIMLDWLSTPTRGQVHRFCAGADDIIAHDGGPRPSCGFSGRYHVVIMILEMPGRIGLKFTMSISTMTVEGPMQYVRSDYLLYSNEATPSRRDSYSSSSKTFSRSASFLILYAPSSSSKNISISLFPCL